MAAMIVHNFQTLRGVARVFAFTAPDDATGALFSAAAPWAVGEVRVSKDGAAAANATNAPTRVGSEAMYLWSASASEMNADFISVTLIDSGSGAGTPADVNFQIMTQKFFDARTLRQELATGGAASTVTLDTLASAIDDFYNEMTISIVGGTGAGQSRTISDYVGATKVVTISRAWSTTPDTTSAFVITCGADVWDQLEGAEPTAVPADGASFRAWVKWIFRVLTNQNKATAGTHVVNKADGTTALGSAVVSTDGTTITRTKFS